MKIKKVLTLLILSISLFSQNNRDYGYAEKIIPELSQFEYFRGEWQISIEQKQADGSYKLKQTKSKLIAKYLDDHKTFQTQFSNSKGFFSTDIRTYDKLERQWKALFLNARDQRWHNFTSKYSNGQMVTVVKGGYSGKKEFDLKVVDTIISNTNFKKNIYKSKDNMLTWEHVYRMDYKKKH